MVLGASKEEVKNVLTTHKFSYNFFLFPSFLGQQ